MAWTMAQNPRCLRGLHFIYSLTPTQPTSVLATLLMRAWPEQAPRRVDEPWPGGAVVRLTVPHVFELRIGERPGEVSLHHRTRTTPEVRAELHRRIESLLNTLEASDHESLPGL